MYCIGDNWSHASFYSVQNFSVNKIITLPSLLPDSLEITSEINIARLFRQDSFKSIREVWKEDQYNSGPRTIETLDLSKAT